MPRIEPTLLRARAIEALPWSPTMRMPASSGLYLRQRVHVVEDIAVVLVYMGPAGLTYEGSIGVSYRWLRIDQ